MSAPPRVAATRPAWGRRTDALVLPLLLVLGGLLGLWGALLVPAGPRVGGHVLSVGAAVGIVGNALVVRLARRASSPFGPTALLIGWVVVVVAASTRRPNGSVVLPGSGDLAVPALVFVVGGLVAGVIAALSRAPRAPRGHR